MRDIDEPGDQFYLGLDLGQTQDFSALVGLRKRIRFEEGLAVARYSTRGIKRWPLGTKYAAVAQDLAKIVAEPPLKGCVCGLDRTGVGAGVLELIEVAKPAVQLRPVMITSGHQARVDAGVWYIPKLDLVAVLQLLLQSGRLEISESLPEAAVLQKELLSFRAKVTAAGNDTFGADESDWRSRPFDDLVLALAIAAWFGERGGPSGPIRMPRQICAAPMGPDLPRGY